MTRSLRWSRSALDDLKAQIDCIASDNPAPARRVRAAVRAAAAGLADRSTGRIGRVPGTFEKTVTGLPYVVAYALTGEGSRESVVILRVIHRSRDWPAGRWPEGRRAILAAAPAGVARIARTARVARTVR